MCLTDLAFRQTGPMPHFKSRHLLKDPWIGSGSVRSRESMQASSEAAP
jgi:hypothetical protein